MTSSRASSLRKGTLAEQHSLKYTQPLVCLKTERDRERQREAERGRERQREAEKGSER